MRSFWPILRAKTLFSKNGQNQRTKLIFSKWAKILLFNFGPFQQVFNSLKLNNLAKEARRLKFESWIWGKASFFGLVEAFAWFGNLHLEVSVDVGRKFLWYASGPGIAPTLDLESGEALYDKRNKIVKRLPFWQRCGFVSQQRLRLGRLTLVNRVPKLKYFLFLACFCN